MLHLLLHPHQLSITPVNESRIGTRGIRISEETGTSIEARLLTALVLMHLGQQLSSQLLTLRKAEQFGGFKCRGDDNRIPSARGAT